MNGHHFSIFLSQILNHRSATTAELHREQVYAHGYFRSDDSLTYAPMARGSFKPFNGQHDSL